MSVNIKNKRIGIACNFFGLSGGMERYSVDIAKEFVSRGYRVIIYTKKVDSKFKHDIGVEIRLCPCGLLPGKLQPLFFSKWLERCKDEIDVMIGCCRTAAADLYICGGTHLGFLRAIQKSPKWYDNLFVELESQAYTNARIIVAHSPLMSQELQDFYSVDASKIVIAYPPVEGNCFNVPSFEQNQLLRAKFGLDNEKKHFLFVSSSHERKGYPLLEKYFSQTDLPIDLLVVGRPIHSECEHIRYLGYRKDIEDLYKATDFTILASSYEPFGLVAIESVLSGKPVVLSDKIGCCAAISNAAKTTFTAGDLNSLDRAIRSVLQSSSYCCSSNDVYSPTSVSEHVDVLERLTEKI